MRRAALLLTVLVSFTPGCRGDRHPAGTGAQAPTGLPPANMAQGQGAMGQGAMGQGAMGQGAMAQGANPHGGPVDPTEGDPMRAAPLPPDHGDTLPEGHPQMPDETGDELPSGHPDLGAVDSDEPNPHATNPLVGVDPAARVSGTITVAPALSGMVHDGDVIYVVVKAVDASGQVPAGAKALAVDKFTAGAWPITFELAVPTGVAVAISARVDHDGDGSSREAGDLEGIARATVPAKDLAIVVDTPIQ